MWWSGRKKIEDLASLLSSALAREDFLGMKQLRPPSTKQQLNDVNHVINYAKTDDYQVWAQEAWSQVLNCVDKLTTSTLTNTEVNYYRGALAQTIKLLQVSYQALYNKTHLERKVVMEENRKK